MVFEMNKCKGKRLLIIGATAYFIDVAKICKKYGILSIVIDYNKNAKAKKYADIALNVDTYDKDAVLEVARKYSVNGVFVGWSDNNLYTAYYVCKMMNLPFYATEEQLNVTTNKKLFKELCRKYNVPVVRELQEDEVEKNFPVVVKPVDDGGNRGIGICRNRMEFEEKYRIAKEQSRKKQVIIEKKYDMKHVNIYYTIVDGDIYLSAMCDRYVIKPMEDYPPLPAVLVHNSVFIDDYKQKVDKNVKKMFQNIGIKNGVAFLQGFVDEKRSFYIYEMGFRLNGGSTYFLMDYYNGYNQIEIMIEYALSGKIRDKINVTDFIPKAYIIVFSVKNGKIGEISGISKLDSNNNVLHYLQMYETGDSIYIEHGVSQSQIFLYVYAKCENYKEFLKLYEDIRSEIIVKDVDGKNMVINYDAKSLGEYL